MSYQVNIAGAPSIRYCHIQSDPDDSRRGAVRKKWRVIFEGCNAVLGHLDHSLRAQREAFVHVVEPLGKDQSLPASLA
ncbi:MAG: hypothetical protein HOM55_02975 [Proteobacteria bacterium]|nr:hypothetical protein [Pseudomonadota bacterium]